MGPRSVLDPPWPIAGSGIPGVLRAAVRLHAPQPAVRTYGAKRAGWAYMSAQPATVQQLSVPPVHLAVVPEVPLVVGWRVSTTRSTVLLA